MLQAFALVKYLQSQGHDVAVIDYRPRYVPRQKVDFFYVSSGFFSPFGIRHLYGLYKMIQAPKMKSYYELEHARRNTFELFFKKFIPVTQTLYASNKQLRSNPPEADLYIAGSDQIWNTNLRNGRDRAFYLDFGAPKRKISYAASFATQEVNPRFRRFVYRQLANFDTISVREKSGLSILRSLGYEGIVVVDPVFLLDCHQWNKVIELDGSIDEDIDEDYILTYDFDSSIAVKEIALRLSALYNCKVYSVSPGKRSYSDKSIVCCTPLEFVSLVKHARCVISNSFHGTAFSMIYRKNFFVVKRKDGLNVRMLDLLDAYNLSNRLIDIEASDDALINTIDYTSVEPILRQDIESSKGYLLNQIDCVH
jgi:hypothetical protein